MPGRAVVTSPGGTAPISTPFEANLQWTGLATVVPFLGSTKDTLTFLAAGLAAAFFFVCAFASTPNPQTSTRTGSTSRLPILIISPFATDDPSPAATRGDILAS